MAGIAVKSSTDYRQHDEEISVNAERVNILIVDDLPEKLLAYKAILEDLGQNLITVRSGEEALKLVLRQEFAVILLDVNMPGMDGFETASFVRLRKKSAHTPIIFLTAFADEMRMAQGYASGAVDYLPTPVVPEILRAKVRVFIELSQMRRQAASQAEEHALRTAAEESGRRSEFLVTASEILARSQNQTDLSRALVKLSIPYLAEESIVWLTEVTTQHGRMERAWSNSAGDIRSESLMPSLDAIPWMAKAIQKVLATGQFQLLTQVTVPSFLQDSTLSDIHFPSRLPSAFMGSALVLPLTMQTQTSGALILMRKDAAYTPGDISLGSDLASRASVALENAVLVEKIQEADQRKDEFLAMLAHELRNPLAPIFNALQIIKTSRDPGLREQTENVIERQLQHMIRLVDDLMDVSRITQGKIELCKERIMLKDVFDYGIETAQPLIKQRNHTLTVKLPEKPLWLEADSVRLSQIFSNLLNNAAKYTDSGGHIEISAQQKGEWIIITVRDDGIGISVDMLPRIFDMFSQVDSSLERTRGGLGIGLTLVKKLVEMHGGSIEALSPGLHKGSEFIVKLPVATPQHTDLPAGPKLEEPVHSPSSLRILVVDDNEAAAKMLGLMMELSGHEIHLAHDGSSAIEIARTCRPAVVFLDIGLPGINGYEVCRAMHNEPSLRNTVFIAQTGWGQTEHRQRSKEAGFDYHLVKPVAMQTLQQLLDNLTLSHERGMGEKLSIH